MAEKIYRISETSLKNIGDAIRFKNGTSIAYAIKEMPDAIKASTATVEDGTETMFLSGTYEGTDLIITENTLLNLREYLEKNEIPLDIKIEVPIPNGCIVPEGTLNITANGTYSVTDNANVNVNVPIPEGYLKPEGILEINKNGEHDVATYEKVNVNVESGITPEGTLEIIENDVYNINTYAEADVNVSVLEPVIDEENNLFSLNGAEVVGNTLVLPYGTAVVEDNVLIINPENNEEYNTSGVLNSNGIFEIRENGLYDVKDYVATDIDISTLDTNVDLENSLLLFDGAEVVGNTLVLPYGTAVVEDNVLVIGDNIVVGGGATPIGVLDIIENGVYDVTGFAEANVNVPIPEGYVLPEGTLEITENGEHSVTEKDKVNVNVPIPEGYIIPEGTLEITKNGEHVVNDYENVEVNVSVTLNPVTNIVLNGTMISWNTPTFNNMSENYTVESINYIINVNGNKLNSNTNSIDASGCLQHGNNTVKIVAMAVIQFNNDEATKTLQCSEVTTTIISATVPYNVTRSSSSRVGTNIYIFGGEANAYNNILKFDVTTETITTLSTTLPYYGMRYTCCSAVGNNIYIFGGYSDKVDGYNLKTILKFDATSETITTLSTTLPSNIKQMCCSAVGNNIYIFGGVTNNGSGNTYLNTILKFDVTTETITTLSTTLPYNIYDSCCSAVDDNIYILGGNSSGNGTLNTILKFDATTETITTLSTTLPYIAKEMNCSMVDNNIYILGFMKGSYVYRDILKFDTITETASVIGSLSETRKYYPCSAVDNNIYMFGGAGDRGSLYTISKASILRL